MENNYKSTFFGTAAEVFNSQVSYLVNLEDVSKVSGKTLSYLLDNVNEFTETIKKIPNDKKFTSNSIQSISDNTLELQFDRNENPNKEINLFSFNILVLCNAVSKIVCSIKFNDTQELFTGTENIDLLTVNLKISYQSFYASEDIIMTGYNFSSLTDKKKDLFGEENYNYVNKKPEIKKETYLRYTSLVSTLKLDETSVITTDSSSHFMENGILNSFSMFCMSGVNITDYDVIKISLYKGDLVMLCLSAIENSQNLRYIIKSLTKNNDYGEQIIYSSGIIQNFIGEIFSYSGACLITRESDNGVYTYYLYDLSASGIASVTTIDGLEASTNNRVYPILDQWSLTGGDLEIINEPNLFKRIKTFSGEILNSADHVFEKIYGDWYKFRNINTGSIIYVSPIGTIKNKSLSEIKVIPINKRLFMVQSPLITSSYFLSPGSYEILAYNHRGYEDNLNLLIGLKSGENKTLSDKDDYMILNWMNYDDDPEYRLMLDGLRKKPLRRKSIPVSEIVDTFRGMIFYKEKDENNELKLYLL